MLEAVLRAMMQAGVTCPRVDGVPGIFQLRGEGWGHLVIPLVEQDTEAPLQSPMHREILESETHHFSFAHGTSQYSLPLILMERIIRPQNYKKGSIPTVGPFGVAGSCVHSGLFYFASTDMPPCMARTTAKPQLRMHACFNSLHFKFQL